MKHKFFYGGVFSNWYKCNFVYKNKNFSNTEQAFMYEKQCCLMILKPLKKF